MPGEIQPRRSPLRVPSQPRGIAMKKMYYAGIDYHPPTLSELRRGRGQPTENRLFSQWSGATEPRKVAQLT